ncbi:GvpL/GvpF family gas vesicle protein [Polyangium aurulentum]|uniref:GvpL/GvpF family gas vesicle protein n=1 Tax=Polyangium aurulentum TaxID=2567896 RepID=UPI00146CD2B0|nr:GvpL/GvpF family gas vesicle protein [Polyangium aurulentum]UQA57622.1 GvpL/GvpF family gas vesicle protein [Polyangium aurulentum]
MKTGMYLYAVLACGHDSSSVGPIGIDGGEISCVALDDVAAAVSPVPRARLRPERKHVAAHHAVLARLMRKSTVLPAAFGLVAPSEEAIRYFLASRRDVLREQLARVAGKAEMGLRVSWNVPDLFAFFVAMHPELREVRDQLRLRREVARGDLIEVGQLFDRILETERDAHFARVSEALSAHGIAVKREPPRSEREVMNLACLVPREQEREFERIVAAAAEPFDDNFTFTHDGPFAPYHFAELTLSV